MRDRRLVTDKTARESDTVSAVFNIMREGGRGLHWIQYRKSPQDEHLRDATDLKVELLSAVSKSQTQQVLINPTDSVLRKTNNLLAMHDGIAAQPCAYIWTDASLTPFERSTTAQYWTNRVWTMARQQALFGESAVPDATCPRCHHGIETVDHVANKCRLPEVIHQVKLRHDEVLYRILPALMSSCSDNCMITCDARNITPARRAKLAGIRWCEKLPSSVLPLDQQRSYPDICIIDAGAYRLEGHISMAAKQQACIYIIELKYAPDLEMHRRARCKALKQHARLQRALIRAGCGTITILPIIIGNAGTIVAETMTAFEKLGLSTSARLTLAKRLAVDSIRRTAKMRRARLSHAAGSPDWHTQDGGAATDPATGADATLPAADPQPDSDSDTGSESADDDNNVEHQPGEALYPPTPSTGSHAANQAACADRQALGCTPAPTQ